MKISDKIYVAGHRGMVGSSIVRKLRSEGFNNLILKTSKELNLINQNDVFNFFKDEKPDIVFMAAAKVGGIYSNNTYKADFIYENLMIEANVVHASYLHNVKKMLFLGSSCIYPKMASQPISEETLLGGFLESTNQPYAIAKIAGIEMCDSYRDQYGCNFISVMPSNLYGPNDNYHPINSHVFAALIRKFIEAKKNNLPNVEVWGTGSPEREFLHVDDLAEACFFLMKNYNEPGIINIGTGSDVTISELANLIKETIGYEGGIVFNKSMPDGTKKKLMCNKKILSLGWKPKIDLKSGIKMIYDDMKNKF